MLQTILEYCYHAIAPTSKALAITQNYSELDFL